MKLPLVPVGITAATLLLSGLGGVALGQGTFSCSNVRLHQALITDCAGTPVGGTNYLMELRVTHPQTQKFDPRVFQVTATTNRPVGLIRVLEGRNTGRFFVGTVMVPFVDPGSEATVEFRAWDASTGGTFETATLRGSSVIKVQLGGVGQPPTMPGTMTQFTGIKLCPAAAAKK